MAPISGMAVDLIAPSLPAIASSLNVGAGLAKNVITTYLLGYAIGSFIIGFLTDAYGRRKLLKLSIFSFVLSSLLPVIFPNEFVLLLARVMQGVFLGCQSGVTRAAVSDILSPHELKKMGTLMGAMWGVGPVVGPVLGGYFQHYMGWQAGFVFFAASSFFIFVAVFFVMPETHLQLKPLRLKTVKADLLEILHHRAFMGLVIIMGLTYALIITFNTLGPFLIQEELGYSAVFYGRYALILGLVFLAATIICRRLIENVAGEKLVARGVGVFIALSALALSLSYVFPVNIYFIAFASAVVFFMAGFIFPLSMGLGIGNFQHIAGTASSVMFLLNILITTSVAFVTSFFHITTAITLVWVYMALQLLVLIVYLMMVRGRLEKHHG